jgi:cytochrome oxidase Cu insertion factor (SCO1/SenC/PrrC family)
MQVRSLIIFILLGFSVFPGCRYISNDNVTISGTFTGLHETQLYLYQILPDSKPLIDSVRTDASGDFSISLQVNKAGFYTLKLNADNEITLVVSPGEKIRIKGNGNSLRNTYEVEGSKESKLYAEYEKFTSTNLNKVDSLSRTFAESRSNPDFKIIKTRLDSAYLQVFNDQKEKVISHIKMHPGSLSSLLVISNNFGPNPLITEQSHPELFLRLDSALFLSYPGNSLVNTFHLRMLDFKAEMADIKAHDELLRPGLAAPEISLPNQAGKELKLSSFKGRLTLVYFWSSWNAPSRQANVNLTSIYNRYHARGFEIYSVSIDSDAELWQKSYLLDKAYWIQVNDPKGLESDYCKTYAVKAIPKMILIGKDGNIIAHDPVFAELEDLIKENL